MYMSLDPLPQGHTALDCAHPFLCSLYPLLSCCTKSDNHHHHPQTTCPTTQKTLSRIEHINPTNQKNCDPPWDSCFQIVATNRRQTSRSTRRATFARTTTPPIIPSAIANRRATDHGRWPTKTPTARRHITTIILVTQQSPVYAFPSRRPWPSTWPTWPSPMLLQPS